MKLPPFQYLAPTSTEELIQAVSQYASDCAILAGGQSLIPELRSRSSQPRFVIDINEVHEFQSLSIAGDDTGVMIGPLVRHCALENPDIVPGPLGRLFSLIAPYVAHPPIRQRGTFAGSLCWANPEAEWCALAAMMDAQLEVRSSHTTRRVSANDWFTGPNITSLAADEVVTSVMVRKLPPDARVAFMEHRTTHSGFATVAVMTSVSTDSEGVVTHARIGVAGGGVVPLRITAAEAVLIGGFAGPQAFHEAARVARTQCDPVSQPHAPAEFRAHAIEVLVRRTLAAAIRDEQF